MPETKISSRTPDEIVARVESIKGDDFFGKRAEVLLLTLPLENVRPFLRDDFDGEWTAADPFAEASEYLEFAVGKMQGERGLSAQRSVDAYREWLWLLTDDATVAEYETLDCWYGDKNLRFAAQRLGLVEKWNELTGESVQS